MFGKSYSTSSLTLATDAIRIVDENITFDFMDYGPSEIPKDHEWQINGIKSMFDITRQRKAAQRVAFNHGVITGVAQKFFDGSPSDLDKFIKQAVSAGAFSGKQIAKDLGKTQKKYPAEFALGFRYAEGFIHRHIESN